MRISSSSTRGEIELRLRHGTPPTARRHERPMFNAMGAVIIEEGLVDEEFVRRRA